MKGILSLLLVVFVINTSFCQKQQLVDADNMYRSLQFVQALQTLNNVIDEYPNLSHAYMQRARVYGALGNEKQRNADINMANYLNPFSHLLYSSLDRSRLLAQKRYTYSNTDSENSDFIKSPINPDAYIELFDNSNQSKEDSIIRLSILEIRKENYKQSALLLSELEGSPITDIVVMDLMGVIEMKNGNLENAIQFFDEAIRLDSSFVIAYHNRSICHKELGNFQSATDDLSKAIELNNDFAHFYFTKALLSEKLKDQSAALKNYEIAIEKRPEYEEALVNYSVILKTMGEYEKAIQALDEAISIDPKNYKNIFLRGNIKLIYGDYQEAIQDFDDFLTYQPNDADSVFNKGMAHVLIGELDEGCDLLLRSKKLGLTKSTDFIDLTCR